MRKSIPWKEKIVNVPWLGRVGLVRDRDGCATFYPGGLAFRSNLTATLIRNGKI